jgi:glutamate-1-semialdehyde 2,1-aminomutase/spore coat polysaccharide biosynthesis protein SpsF
MKVLAICQARMGSTRVPGKVMRRLGNKPVLRWTLDAVEKAELVDDFVLATSTDTADDVIEQYCDENNLECFRGSETDVLDRYYQCAKKHHADIVLRFTCDCPFLDPGVINEVIKLRDMTNADYASNCYPPTYPDGLDTECFTFAALEAAWNEAKSQVDRDCCTQFIVRNRDRFKVVNLTCPLPGLDKERWVLDTEDDWRLCQGIVSHLTKFSYPEILSCLDENPKIRELNAGGIRNERFYEALAEERLSPRTFERSTRVFQRAIQTIPGGAQTYSKSHIQFPTGAAPLCVSYGDGAYIFDLDGNRYLDLINGICPVILGYGDPDVNEAIRRQLDNGISFSLATKIETELSELLCHHIPCAEMVKLGKSGTDVTTAAVRLARAYTGRDHVLLSGYHGWSDWSIACTDRNHGVPEDVRHLTHRIPYGDDPNVNRPPFPWAHTVAAIIVEPNDNPEYLKGLREHCTKHGIVLIFDEIITGFRYDLGGAQKLYGVTPDLACFGKAMANGMPISALVGKRNIMKMMESPDVFYSGTFFGETLSIAAAIATIKKLEREKVIPYLYEMGTKVINLIGELIDSEEINDFVSISGNPTKSTISFKGEHAGKLRTLFIREMIQQGVLIMATNTMSYAHKKPEIQRIFKAYDHTLSVLKESLMDGSIEKIEPTQAAPLRAA